VPDNEITTPDIPSLKAQSVTAAHAAERWLQTYCGRNPEVIEGVVMLLDGDPPDLEKKAQWPMPRPLGLTMSSTAKASLQRMQPISIVPGVNDQGEDPSCILAVPLRSSSRTLGTAVIAIRTSDSKVTASLLSDLEQAVVALVATLNSIPVTTRPADAAKLLQMQATFLSNPKLANAAGAFASELADMLKFNRVTIGMLENGDVEIVAMSHTADFKTQQELLRLISSAMEESVDQTAAIVYPAAEEGQSRINLAHAALVKRTANATCCIPLVSNHQIVGAICLEHQSMTPPSPEAIVWYEHIACLVAPLLQLKQQNERAWYTLALQSLKDSWYKLRNNNQHMFVLAGSVLAITALMLIPVDYRIGAPAHIEGATQRVLSAPADGFIHQAHVRPGDAVKAGDILIELADQELMLEKRKWESEIIQQENNFSAALARQDRTEYAISQAKASQARAELDLVQQQLERSHITAPIDGIVLDGDLSQSLGAPVKRGDALMTLAPSGQYRLMIDVDERDIANVKLGQTGSLALSAQPTKKLTFTVKRITPVASIKEGQNTFEVEAQIADKDILLRPGLQGVAKIEAGSRPVFWSLTHRIIDWVKLSFWSWGA